MHPRPTSRGSDPVVVSGPRNQHSNTLQAIPEITGPHFGKLYSPAEEERKLAKELTNCWGQDDCWMNKAGKMDLFYGEKMKWEKTRS